MSLTSWFGWKVDSDQSDELPDIFPITIKKDEFINTDIVTIYTKILTDVVERCSGISDDQMELLWDNCLKSAAADGLITLLAKAMSEKKELFLVYEKSVGVVRVATQTEKAQIEADYKARAESKIGVYISFKNYVRSDMVKFYSALEFCTVGALSKSMNLSKAIQIKINELRASVSLTDSAGAKAQALAIAKGLGDGRDVMLDAKDEIVTSMPDLTAAKTSIDFLDSKRSFYLGLPAAYINGEQTGGLGTTGENDTKAIERGLKAYYFAIVKPVLETLFGIKLTYKSQDFRQIGQALEVIKTFELVSEELVGLEAKRRIVNALLDLSEAENKVEDPPKVVDVTPPAAGAIPPAPAVKPPPRAISQ